MISFHPFFARQPNTHTHTRISSHLIQLCYGDASTHKETYISTDVYAFFLTAQILADVHSSLAKKERFSSTYVCASQYLIFSLSVPAPENMHVFTHSFRKYSISRENNVWAWVCRGVDFSQASFCWIDIDCHLVSYHGHSFGRKCLRRSLSLSLSFFPFLPFSATFSQTHSL